MFTKILEIESISDQCFPFSQFSIEEVFKKFQIVHEDLKNILTIAGIDNLTIAKL